MARIRTIKPEFWTDEKIVSLSLAARLFFVGLWNFVDDDGRCDHSPTRLKLQILPADKVDARKILAELHRNALISIYSVEGKEYLQVMNFAKHQKVDKRTPSKLPPPNPAELPRVPPDCPDGMEGNGRDQGKEESYTYLGDQKFNDLWISFLEMRKSCKAKPTAKAIELLMKKLHAQPLAVARDMLERSIENSWKGVFPPKGGSDGKRKSVVEEWASDNGVDLNGGLGKRPADHRGALPEAQHDEGPDRCLEGDAFGPEQRAIHQGGKNLLPGTSGDISDDKRDRAHKAICADGSEPEDVGRSMGRSPA